MVGEVSFIQAVSDITQYRQRKKFYSPRETGHETVTEGGWDGEDPWYSCIFGVMWRGKVLEGERWEKAKDWRSSCGTDTEKLAERMEGKIF